NVTATAEPETEVQGNKVLVTIAVMLAALMAVLDISIVNVALNDIRASFGTPIDQIGWISVGYMMANIVVIPLTGWLQRRFGFKRYFVFSLLVFTAASVLCGFAWNLWSLVFFRVLQGIGGGAIIPTAQGILFARYPRREHAMAGALYGLGAITGPLLGPTIGGYLIEIASWHWIFFINLPIGILAATLAWRVIEQPKFAATRDPIDWTGIGLLAVGMSSLQYVLEEGNREGWLESNVIAVLMGVAAISLVTFIVHELETEQPIVDLRVFKERTYAAGTGINFLTGFALFSGSFMFSLYAGSVLRYEALDIGRVFMVAGTISLVTMPLFGRLGPKVDGRYLLAIGIAIVAFSQYVASNLTAAAGFWDAVQPNFLRSLGLGFIFIPVSVIALSGLSPEQRGNATGLFNLTRELGGSLGTALMGMLLSDGVKIHGSYLAEAVNPYNPLVQEQLAQLSNSVGSQTYQSQLVPESILQSRVDLQAMVLTFQSGFRWVALAMALGLILVLLLKKPSATGGEVVGAH
ncbi:MAG: DHA2 family efflux MFS transporter permease subunit, partial [Polyangiaceae bacterium]